MLARRGGAKSFGRVRVTHDELKQSNSTIDFAELIEKKAAGRVQHLPAPEEEVAVRWPEANVPAQLQTMKNDGKGIFEDIIAKYSVVCVVPKWSSGGDSRDSDNVDDARGGDADDASDESSKLPRFIIYIYNIYIHTYIHTYIHLYIHI
jgi:hypothetical protein